MLEICNFKLAIFVADFNLVILFLSLAHAVRVTLAIGVFLTYSLVFYIPMQVIQPWFQRLFSERNQNLGDAILRITLTTLTCK